MSNETPHPHPSRPARRRRRSLDEARALVHSWQSSGLTQERFAQREGIPTSSVTSCCRRVRLADEDDDSSTATFVQLVPDSAMDSNDALEVVTPGGLRLRITSAGSLSMVAPTLRAMREAEA